MLSQTGQAMRAVPGALVGTKVGIRVLPSIRVLGTISHAGGVVGGVAGFISGGLKCLYVLEPGSRTLPKIAQTLGRDTTAGIASGVTASAAALYVASAGATVGAVVSAPVWLAGLTATVAAIGVGHVVGAACNEVWDYCAGGMKPANDALGVSH